MNWIIAIAVLVVVGYILDREIYFYEGAHLGPRIQAWLYDRWARQYDAGKVESQKRDGEFLARPLLEKISAVPEPFILDFATGTGRMSLALLKQTAFNGHIIALDLSRGMLEQAVAKFNQLDKEPNQTTPWRARVDLVRHPALPLPFPDSVFDVVCCLEVLELFPGMDAPLVELTRVLKPGGVMLTTRGTEASGRQAQVKSKPQFTTLLERHGLTDIQIVPFWKLFDRVFAQKLGAAAPVQARTLTDVLRCSKCGAINWRKEAVALHCQQCGQTLGLTPEGIVLNG